MFFFLQAIVLACTIQANTLKTNLAVLGIIKSRVYHSNPIWTEECLHSPLSLCESCKKI